MANPNWTLIGTTTPLSTLKSEMYCNIPASDTSVDTILTTLGEMVTAQMISWLDNPNIDVAAPGLSLQRAALKQTAYEYKQRKTPGLTSVSMTDGSINKYQIDEFLKDVEKILWRYRRYALAETE